MRYNIQVWRGQAGDDDPGLRDASLRWKQDAGETLQLNLPFTFKISSLTTLLQVFEQVGEWDSLLLLERKGRSKMCSRYKILARLLRPKVLAV